MSDKEKSSSILNSLRRNVVRVAPASLVEEMRPMLSAARSSTTEAQQATQQHSHRRTIITQPSQPSSSSHHHHHAAAFEISLRDKSDATAKRGFRVQVPKRLLFYTLLVFVVLPLFLFGYIEMHNRSSKNADHQQDHHPPSEQDDKKTNHAYDKYKVNPDAIMQEEETEELVVGGSGAFLNGTTTVDAAAADNAGPDNTESGPEPGGEKDTEGNVAKTFLDHDSTLQRGNTTVAMTATSTKDTTSSSQSSSEQPTTTNEKKAEAAKVDGDAATDSGAQGAGSNSTVTESSPSDVEKPTEGTTRYLRRVDSG